MSTALTFRAIHAGGGFTCALNAFSGAPWCWGANTHGRLGNGDTVTRTTPVLVSGGLQFTRMTTGYTHSCGLDGQGQAWCWGSNARGQLGLGDTLPRTVPVALGRSFQAIAAGDATTCALDASGAAWCWGAAAIMDGAADVLSPTAVPGQRAFQDIQVGGATACGRATGGSVLLCWGRNTTGQFGNGTLTSSPAPVASVASGVSAFSVGSAHACAINSAGLLCWGADDRGQLGNGLPQSTETTPRRIIQ